MKKLKPIILSIFLVTSFQNLVIAQFKVSSTQQKPKSKLNKTQKGAIIGVVTGGVVGGIIGSKSKNTAIGAILGATVGGAVGAIIGNKMDKQAKKIEDELGKAAKVERVGEGIRVTFDNKMLFAFGKSYLNDDNKADLQKFAGSLNEYPDTDLLIVGHTDNVGSNATNQSLSVRRASAVKTYLDEIGVASSRLKASGKGESQPIVSNSSEYNRSLNRRVEVAISANDKMKADAKAEAGL
jgi:outer membrane protein OmpA-like peptidoglycan-associated protein